MWLNEMFGLTFSSSDMHLLHLLISNCGIITHVIFLTSHLVNTQYTIC